MKNLKKICKYLNKFLNIKEIRDFSGAFNGLQIQSNKKIARIASAVDASLAVIKEAVNKKIDLLIVHHGLFWQNERRLTGAEYQKISLAIKSQLAIYSCHLPLDCHPQIGNNAIICQLLGIKNVEPCLPIFEHPIGLKGELNISTNNLFKKIKEKINPEAKILQFSNKDNKTNKHKIVVMSGGGGGDIYKAAELGIDTFITGEGSHWNFASAQELKINLIFAGHYATEVFGVQTLGKKIAQKFDLQHIFIDEPSGL